MDHGVSQKAYNIFMTYEACEIDRYMLNKAFTIYSKIPTTMKLTVIKFIAQQTQSI